MNMNKNTNTKLDKLNKFDITCYKDKKRGFVNYVPEMDTKIITPVKNIKLIKDRFPYKRGVVWNKLWVSNIGMYSLALEKDSTKTILQTR